MVVMVILVVLVVWVVGLMDDGGFRDADLRWQFPNGDLL